MAEENLHVKFNSLELIWLKNADGSGPLAWPDQIDEDSHVYLYHVYSDGNIRRLGKVIGSVGDLQVVSVTIPK